MSHSTYYDLPGVEAVVREGGHRQIIGGLWDEMGDHQMRFLVAQGMRPDHRLLDIGCGSLRLGARAIAWLEGGHYFGTDISAALIDAGRSTELDEALRAKAPQKQFEVSEDFDFSFLPAPMDFAIAQSVFTHLPLNHLRRCLAMLAPHMVVGGRFFVTYFECPPGVDLHEVITQPPAGVITHEFKDPYHYRVADLEWAIDGGPWTFQPIGDWAHPRGQHIVGFQHK